MSLIALAVAPFSAMIPTDESCLPMALAPLMLVLTIAPPMLVSVTPRYMRDAYSLIFLDSFVILAFMIASWQSMRSEDMIATIEPYMGTKRGAGLALVCEGLTYDPGAEDTEEGGELLLRFSLRVCITVACERLFSWFVV